MVGIRLKDIDKDVLMIFMLSFEYQMSFTNLLKLFKISKQYFWTFMEICSPMLKMGVRKASMIRKSVDKILPYLTNQGEKEELTIREENILDKFLWFVEDSFSDGEGCLSIQQLEAFPFIKGYSKRGNCIAFNYDGVVKNIDDIEYIKIGSENFYKTTRMLFYIEKYCGNMDMNRINNLSIRDMLRKIDEGEEKLEQESYQCK